MWLGSDGLPDEPAGDEVVVRAHVQTETVALPGAVAAAVRGVPSARDAAPTPTPWRVPAVDLGARAVA
ncbi:MAG TPA: hypothetical protein VFG42_09330 [Baekduia sp.]|uniref:hypothetical protein n=1 Tax=Baekduia sp. TaxID=2600305 RepID=UPI002D794BCF|nr:hypothetical protein [Baekduia sp.]HET6506979.1 hypothetical protein [Baekduia sp.]